MMKSVHILSLCTGNLSIYKTLLYNLNRKTMMKNILFTTFLFISLSANSQNQSWNANAVNGQNYNIDSLVTTVGKTVLVDISAYWCQPCWDWHLQGIMEKIYKEFGPSGTNDVEIFFVDGDQGSSIACLQGACLSSMGNWLASTPYPIIGPYGNGHYVQTQYVMNAYPTLYMHCPGQSAGAMISRIDDFDDFLESWHTACPAAFDHGSVDAMLFHNEEVEHCEGSQVYTDLFNQGTDSLYAATITLKQNGSLLDTKNWTGALAPFGHERVYFDNYIYTGTAGTFEKEVIVAGDVNTLGNIETDSHIPAPTAPNVNMTLELKTASGGFAVKWKLLDENNVVVGSNPSTNYQSNMLYTYNWTLNTNTCYTFIVWDSIYGSGLCCDVGQGYYKIRNTADTLDTFIFGGNFKTFSEQKKFITPAIASVSSYSKQNVEVYPNPTTGIVNINLPGETDAIVSVVNVLGEKVLCKLIDRNTDSSVDLSSLNDGYYWIQIATDDEMIIRPVTLSK